MQNKRDGETVLIVLPHQVAAGITNSVRRTAADLPTLIEHGRTMRSADPLWQAAVSTARYRPENDDHAHRRHRVANQTRNRLVHR